MGRDAHGYGYTSIGLKGLEGYKVQVEVQLLPGIEGVSIVGLPDALVKESKDLVMSALYAKIVTSSPIEAHSSRQ
ncbi:hypothetical protein [Salipaludibacillus daqingensis]|uniref:hypothetical protein n=1 Tax=Salipaludibacillus daqingensis TaxID=3041001 RepID=UPI002474FEC9|nr:hypothetical protein [Salipaludibacillus daqingensis]